MSKSLPLALLFLAACAASTSASAVEGTPVEGCVELSESHQGMRHGSQFLLVKDGDAHYRVGFGKTCSALTLASKVTITTEGTANRLCATGTTVASKRARCAVRTVEAIDAETFDRYDRRG